MPASPEKDAMKTLALIIGAGKSGTTSLFHYLSQHPDIRPSDPKEVNFFSLHWDKGFDWYRAQFPEADSGEEEVFLDASPSYTDRHLTEGVAERIASIGIPVKLIYTVRHPVDRIRSHASHNNARGIDAPRRYSPVLTPTPEQVDAMIQYTRYGYQLAPFERLFPEQTLVLTVDDMRADRAGTLDRVSDFLGIARFSPEDARARNEIGDLYAKSWVRRVRRGPLGPAVKKLLPEGLRRAAVKFGSDTPPEVVMSPETERRIIDAVRPDLIHLRDRYGIDAAKLWGIPL